MDNEIRKRAEAWKQVVPDDMLKMEVETLLNSPDETALTDAFYKDLEFGTGGMRGLMGAGTNRVNSFTFGAATQGFSNYLNNIFPKDKELAVVIGYDTRNNSRRFAEETANILSANGIKAFLFSTPCPTPQVSFAIRKLKAKGGIIITASHNPKEYNGYKVYWEDGSQIVSPHDKGIMEEVAKTKIEDIRFEAASNLIEHLGNRLDEPFVHQAVKCSISAKEVRENKDMGIVYTPIHGTGKDMVPFALKTFGFTNIISVEEQNNFDGNFPTVTSPNPEEPVAMAMAMEKAKETRTELVLATDPDADRLGVGVKDTSGNWVLLNGNQTALLFIYYTITSRKERGLLSSNDYIASTIVTTELLSDIAEKNEIQSFRCYTGFKYIAMIMREMEGKLNYIGGGEESFGYLPSDFVRDKDAVTSCALMAEIAAWAKSKGKSLYELLIAIYSEYGFSKEELFYVVREGKKGAEEITSIMKELRTNPCVELLGEPVISYKDYLSGKDTNPQTGEVRELNMGGTADVLQFFTDKGTKVSVRPSGTEPKIKYYFEVREPMKDATCFEQASRRAADKINRLKIMYG